MWRSNYDMPADEMEREVERLWGQVQPLYEQLHCYVRAELNDALWRRGPAARPADPRRPARQHVGAGMGQL